MKFLTTMMPKCMSMVLDSLDQPARERLAREMIDSLVRLGEQTCLSNPRPPEGA